MDDSILNTPQKLELHYFFKDESHTMDAIIRNKCESEIIAILKEIKEVLDIDLDVETEAYLEGGLKEIWTFITKNKYTLLLVTNILVNVLSDYITKDYELNNLQKDEIRLSIEEKLLNIEKLKNELKKELKKDKPKTSVFPDTLEILKHNKKIIRHKSNFYKNLDSYLKVTQISTNSLKGDNTSDKKPIIIPRNDFKKFILFSDELPIIVDEDASIEIISPVLKKGKYKWRGIYKGNIIDFYMKDKLFKSSVIQQEISFKNGSVIDCILEMSRKIDEMGEEYIFNYSVTLIFMYRDDLITVKTKQGKQYKAKKDFEKSQLKLFG